MKLAESLISQSVLLAFVLGVSAKVESPSIDPDVVGLKEGFGIGVGKWIGTYQTTHRRRRYEAYEGIPYAKPPVEHRRFEPPEDDTIRLAPVKPVLIVKQPGAACMQYDRSRNILRGQEDCLYLNVYRPEFPYQRNTSLPVIFFIHGDDFQTGSGADHGPKYLMDSNVILVTFNYRLGPLGFLSTEDDIVPGNMGLKDQVFALRWVKRNINHFNGDSDNIAIYGHGAGGASVHYHYLSKQTKGLFKKGMSMSGTALTPWAQMKQPLNRTKRLALGLGCPDENVVDMIKCMKGQPADAIAAFIDVFRTYMQSPFAPFGPVVESGNNYWTFINKPPADIISAGQAHNLPWITGFVGADGLAVASNFIADSNLIKKLNNEWTTRAPYLLEYDSTVRKSEQDKVSNLIKEQYFGEWPIASWTTHPILNMIGDRLFVRHAVKSALLHTRTGKGPVWFYRMSYRGSKSYSQVTTSSDAFFGASHKDDLAYIFELDFKMPETGDGQILRDKLIDLWVSYAADKLNSIPKVDIEWPPVTKNGTEVQFLHILRPTEIQIEISTNLGREKFWDSLRIKENDFAECIEYWKEKF